MLKHFKLYGVLILAVLTITMAACGEHETKIEVEDHKKPVEVSVDVPKLTPFTDPFTLSGTIKSHRRTVLSSKVPAQILDISVEEGSLVRAGQMIVKLDDRESRVQMAKAEVQTSELKAGIDLLNERLQELKSRVKMLFHDQESYISQAELAQANFDRYKKLLEKDVATQQEFDVVKTELDRANATVAKSQEEYNLLMAQKKQLDAKHKQLLAQVETNKIQKAEAMVNKTYSEIVVPFNSVVIKKEAEVGDMAMPGKPLITIEDPYTLFLEINVDESQSLIFKPASRVDVYVDSLSQKAFEGKVREIIPSSDPLSHTVKVKIDLNPSRMLHSGMYARVVLWMGGENLFVPRTAVVTRGQITGVYIVDNKNLARFRIIKAGQDIQGFIQVLSGLSGEDKVIISNLENISDGTRVKVLGEK